MRHTHKSMLNEHRIINLCCVLLTFSVAVLFGGAIFIFLILFSTPSEIFTDPSTLLLFLFLLIYFGSVYLLLSIEGKSLQRRFLSWLQSAFFHTVIVAGAAVYLYVDTKDLAPLIFLTPEILIGILSMIGTKKVYLIIQTDI